MKTNDHKTKKKSKKELEKIYNGLTEEQKKAVNAIAFHAIAKTKMDIIRKKECKDDANSSKKSR